MPQESCGFDEKKCVEQLKMGNKEALEPIVEYYKKRAYGIALGLVRNPEDAMEMSQLAFIKAYRSISNFDNQRAFFPWFYQIIRNTCLNFLEKKKRLREEALEDLQEEQTQTIFALARNPEEDYRSAELRILLAEAIRALKPKEREILLMQHFYQMSYAEIADTLEIPIGTVMSRLYQARNALRGYLEKHHHLGGIHDL